MQAFYYYVKDRDNIRFFFKDKNGNGFISIDELEEHRYYPFGMEIEGPWKKAWNLGKYLYNQKEFDMFSGLMKILLYT